MKAEQIKEVLELIKFQDYKFELVEKGGDVHLMARYEEPDTYTGAPSVQTTRKWYISEHATKSEIVQTAFLSILTSMEHRAREGFLYKGKRVFGPHFNVDALWELLDAGSIEDRCFEKGFIKSHDYRKPAAKTKEEALQDPELGKGSGDAWG